MKSAYYFLVLLLTSLNCGASYSVCNKLSYETINLNAQNLVLGSGLYTDSLSFISTNNSDMPGGSFGKTFNQGSQLSFSNSVNYYHKSPEYQYLGFSNVTDIELAPDSSLFLVRSDSLWHLKNDSFSNIPVPEKIFDISVSKTAIYLACMVHLYKIPLSNTSSLETLDTWNWDPYTKIEVKSGTNGADSLLFYITSWGSRSGWILRYPDGNLTQITWGGAGYGMFDMQRDSTIYIYYNGGRRYNLVDFTYSSIPVNDIRGTFCLNGKSLLVSSSAFSSDYGDTWTTFIKPTGMPNVSNSGYAKIDESTLALADNNSNSIIIIKNGTLYPTSLETPDIFNLKVFDGKYLWGTGQGGELIKIEFANFSIITGITPDYSNKILVYPNPVSDDLTIDYAGNSTEIRFKILNSIGLVIFDGKFVDKNIVHTSSFIPGVYFIKFDFENRFEFKKVIKY